MSRAEYLHARAAYIPRGHKRAASMLDHNSTMTSMVVFDVIARLPSYSQSMKRDVGSEERGISTEKKDRGNGYALKHVRAGS